MVLRRIEQSPRYRKLLDDLLDEMEPLVAEVEGPMTGRVGFVFMSGPNARTPVHFDGEQNFLLQIRQSKAMSIGRLPDEMSYQRAAERNDRFLAEMPKRFETFDLQPGDGVYVPADAPHWVLNGPKTSVSLSITFSTPSLVRTQRIHAFSAGLRRFGLSPRAPGHSPVRDRAKAAVIRTTNGIRRRLPGGAPQAP